MSSRLFTSIATLKTQVPTCVFTPMEYGFVGLSEEAAIAEHGDDNVEVKYAAS